MMKPIKVLWIASALAMLSLTASADSKHGHNFKSPKVSANEAPRLSEAEEVSQAVHSREPWVKAEWRISGTERERIREYVQSYDGQRHGRAKNLPPGLAKKVARGGQLPPGWEKKCVVGETMPPDVYRQARPLPPELVVKLPPPPEPTITVAVGGKVVRLLEATRQILDVFDVHVRF